MSPRIGARQLLHCFSFFSLFRNYYVMLFEYYKIVLLFSLLIFASVFALHIVGKYIIVVWFILFHPSFFGTFVYYSAASTPISPFFVFCMEWREMVLRFFFEVSFQCPFSLLLCYNLVEAAYSCLEFILILILLLEKYTFLFVHSECVSIAMFNGGAVVKETSQEGVLDSRYLKTGGGRSSFFNIEGMSFMYDHLTGDVNLLQ